MSKIVGEIIAKEEHGKSPRRLFHLNRGKEEKGRDGGTGGREKTLGKGLDPKERLWTDSRDENH